MRSKDNRQFMVGIPEDSEMLTFYLREAQEHGVRLPTWIYQLLKDRYEALRGNGQGAWFPRNIQVPLPAQEVKPTNGHATNGKVHAALVAFGGEDDDEEDNPTEKMRAV